LWVQILVAKFWPLKIFRQNRLGSGFLSSDSRQEADPVAGLLAQGQVGPIDAATSLNMTKAG
jgi:hypothetical protein